MTLDAVLAGYSIYSILSSMYANGEYEPVMIPTLDCPPLLVLGGTLFTKGMYSLALEARAINARDMVIINFFLITNLLSFGSK